MTHKSEDYKISAVKYYLNNKDEYKNYYDDNKEYFKNYSKNSI